MAGAVGMDWTILISTASVPAGSMSRAPWGSGLCGERCWFVLLRSPVSAPSSTASTLTWVQAGLAFGGLDELIRSVLTFQQDLPSQGFVAFLSPAGQNKESW